MRQLRTIVDLLGGRLTRSPLLLVGLVTAALSTGPVCADAPTPLHSVEIPDLYQRIITLPGAELHEAAGAPGACVDEDVEGGLPVFSVYYVYDRTDDEEWIQVGESISRPDGWICASKSQPWNLMLVMQYAPPGSFRDLVLFFEENPNEPDALPEQLLDITKFDGATLAEQLLDQVKSGADSVPGLAASEPYPPPEGSENPYLMPILDFEHGWFERGDFGTVFLKVASLNAKEPTATVTPMKNAIVFVFDTTVSMKPYIELTEEFAKRLRNQLGGLNNQIFFGLVGYRDYMGKEPQHSGKGAPGGCRGLEYVTRIYQGLDVDERPEAFGEGLQRMDVACVSTREWREDAVAGLMVALGEEADDGENKLNWDPFEKGLRLVVLVTDASARDRGNDWARYKDEGITSIKDLAIRKEIAIIPIHLNTLEAEEEGNRGEARQQYMELGLTGDINLQKYYPVGLSDDGSLAPSKQAAVDQFATQLGKLEEEIVSTLSDIAAKKVVTQVEPGDPLDLGALFKNEIYTAQQKYLGAREGAQAPPFYRAWASDRDLIEPRSVGLRVAVFLNRLQLNELAERVERLLRLATTGDKGPEGFFTDIQKLAFSMSTDPQRMDVAKLLPAYLEKLPYRSDILQMTEDEWFALGPQGQEEVIEDLRSKTRFYERIEGDEESWLPLGAESDAESVALVPLDVLP